MNMSSGSGAVAPRVLKLGAR